MSEDTASTTVPQSNPPQPIWVFTSSRTDPKILEAILVQRHQLLQDAVERVRESATTGHKHHLLFVGPRGCGKTHLVTLIVSRVLADTDLAERLHLAWLNEDETCTTVLELLLKIYAALQKRYPQHYPEATLEQTFEKPKARDASDFLSHELLAALGTRTLLVVTENLDAIFDGLGDAGQKELRAFIQENPRLCLVATAQRLVEDLSDRGRPFFGFFQTEYLKPLKVEEASELLLNIARVQGKDSLVEFLTSSRGRSRIRALHHLSGGNHRIYIVLSQFITRESMDALLAPFLKMVDELTPYYQERIRWLPTLQRKIVEFLCTRETTVPVKEIAKRLFATPQTISNQLQDLREKGYVDSNQRGRESLYEITEPLMRICVEVKEIQSHEPLRLIVDFLRVWYDEPELKRRLDIAALASESRPYLERAIERNAVEGNLRKRILLKDLERSLAEKTDISVMDFLLQVTNSGPEAIALSIQCAVEGNPEEAKKYLDEAITEGGSPSDKAALLYCRGMIHGVHDETNDAINDFTTVIELRESPVAIVAMALTFRGFVLGRRDETLREIADYTAAIELIGAPVLQIAEALFCRGVAHSKIHEMRRAIDDYTAVTQLPGAPVEQVGKAFFRRGLAYLGEGKKPEAKSSFEALASLSTIRPELAAIAYFMLARFHVGEGQWREGFGSLQESLRRGAHLRSANRLPLAGLIASIFTAGLGPDGRREKLAEIICIYRQHGALSVLGESAVKHVGQIFQNSEPFPSTDNLEDWYSAWEEAAKDIPDFKLTLRLLRIGTHFLKAGGKDRGILLDLTTPERRILEQTFGFADTDEAEPK